MEIKNFIKSKSHTKEQKEDKYHFVKKGEYIEMRSIRISADS